MGKSFFLLLGVMQFCYQFFFFIWLLHTFVLRCNKKKANNKACHPLFPCAQNRTRTCTTAKPLAPETSASTNSATWAIMNKFAFLS